MSIRFFECYTVGVCAVASRCYVVLFRKGENIMVMYKYQEKV
jgi:hypothetical protein